MSVTDYLERARECAALADKAKETHKPKILAIADAWLKLADDAALEDEARIQRKWKIAEETSFRFGV